MSPFASRLGRALTAAVCIATLAVSASAQPKSPTDEARELARQGFAALDAENYKEALAKGAQAEALYHAAVHLLLVGQAQAGLGKLADALTTFEKLAAEPLGDAAPKVFKEAQENGRKRMRELLARVPSLLVAVENADGPATVTVDGQKVDFSNGVAVRMDPGDHTIEVTAAGANPVKQTVKLPEKGGVVRVPIVLNKPNAAGTGSASASVSAAPSVTSTASAAPTTTATAGPDPGMSRTPAYIAFGAAGAGIIVGAITGGLSLSMTSALKKSCPDNSCPQSEQGSIDSANTMANVSTATFVIGGVAAAAGVVLMLVDVGPKSPPKGASKVRVEPWISIGGAGVRGSF
jgi:hypothetical protein